MTRSPYIPEAVADVLDKAAEKFDTLTTPQKCAVGIAGGLASIYAIGSLYQMRQGRHNKPSSFELSGGSIPAKQVAQVFDDYSKSYGQEAGTGIVDRSKTVHLVDVFYSLVTDMYEWGWGQSFHFSPKLPGKNWKQSEAAHEARLPAILGLKPGQKCLDVGCGVGGPMRTIASTSGAQVTGITINEYQVQRAKHHNNVQGVSALTNVVRGDFTNMPFEADTFDGAYAIEATCHAPKLEQVYGEVFRVLKPGSRFVSYEWVATKVFDHKNDKHVKIIDEINFGNGLPEMRTWKEAEQAGINVGFKLVWSQDIATTSVVAGPWYDRLKMGRWVHYMNHGIVSFLDAIFLAPKGLKEVHHMLVDVAHSLVEGGETGIFTPMHMLVFEKPAAAPKK